MSMICSALQFPAMGGHCTDEDLKKLGRLSKTLRHCVQAILALRYVERLNIVVDNRGANDFDGSEIDDMRIGIKSAERRLRVGDVAGLPNWVTKEILDERNPHLRRDLLYATRAKQKKMGRCDELACIALTSVVRFLSKGVKIGVYVVRRKTVKDSGHVAMILGDHISTAIICDPWSRVVCHHKDRQKFIQNYLGSREDGIPLLEPFDPKQDVEELQLYRPN